MLLPSFVPQSGTSSLPLATTERHSTLYQAFVDPRASIGKAKKRHQQENPLSRNAKDKLNASHAVGAIGIAAVIGIVAQSWVLFILVAAGLIAVSLATGEIRLPTNRKPSKRR